MSRCGLTHRKISSSYRIPYLIRKFDKYLKKFILKVWVGSDTNVYIEQLNVSRAKKLVVDIIILQFVLLGNILLPKLVCFGILFGKVVHF